MAATGTLAPFAKSQWFDNNGDPASGYKLFTYEAGTTTKLNTYSDVTLTTANANPIVLDSAGRATVYLTATSYKFVLATSTDTDPPASPVWTQDNIPATPSTDVDLDVVATAGENLAATDAVYLSAGDGGRTAGRWYKADADLTYASTDADAIGVTQDAITSAAVGRVRINGRATGYVGLSAGSVYYISATAGAITSSAPANARAIAVADSSTTIILSNWLASPVATETLPGIVSTTTQTFGGAKTFAGAVTLNSTLAVTGQSTFTLQPLTKIGTSSTNATVGGVFFTDVVSHEATANVTDLVLSTTTIPANMLNADGKMVHVFVGSSTTNTGGGQHQVELDVGGTSIILINTLSAAPAWWAEARIVRIDSDSVDVFAWCGFTGITTDIASFSATRINSLVFTGALALRTLCTTGAGSTLTQTFFSAAAAG